MTSTPQILPKRTCTCGHGEGVHDTEHMCSECDHWHEGDGHCRGCKCEEFIVACQNCGEERKFSEGGYDVCSRRCLYQIEYAKELVAA